jgi:hypothetical protein
MGMKACSYEQTHNTAQTCENPCVDSSCPRLEEQDEKEKSMMSQRYRVEKEIDQAIGRRMLSTCWLFAGLGVSTFQMLLLAQAWFLSKQAFVPACLASAWVLGTVLGMHLRADARLWSSCLVLCALLWLGCSRLLTWQTTTPLLSIEFVQLCALGVLALLLGTVSAAWLSQRRLWSPAGEQVTLLRALVGTTAGLFVVWVLPAWAGLLGLLSVMPLLAFDTRFASRAPQSEETGVVQAWISRYWQPERRQLRLQTVSLPRNWWWSYLVEHAQESKGYVLLTLLASSTAVILGSIWGAVPTAFAAGMLETHELDKLVWLLTGQFVALVIGVCWFRASRGVVGFPDRLLPPSRQTRTFSLALSTLVVIGSSLVTLGLPFLQAPWWLMVSLASYTLAAGVWGILLPRLRPSTDTLASAQRHLLHTQGRHLSHTLHVRYSRAQEEHFNRLLMTAEGVLIASFIPVVGWLIDVYSSVDRVLVLVGLCSILGLALLAFVRVVWPLKYPQPSQAARSTYKKSNTRSWRPGYNPVRLAW